MNEVCIILPCYNEQNRLPVDDIVEFYNLNSNFFLLFVNDGSRDNTSAVIEKLMAERKDRIFLLDFKLNEGKAEAVRQGMLQALKWRSFDIIGFLDADLSIPLDEAKRLTSYFNNEKVNFVFGSRIQRLGVNIKKKLYRHIIGRTFATITSSMLNLKVYDTQCGVKFFRTNLVNSLFKEKFQSRWIFDIEIFYRFKDQSTDYDINSITREIPLDKCLHIDGSKISFFDFLKIPFEMINLFYYYKIKNKSNN